MKNCVWKLIVVVAALVLPFSLASGSPAKRFDATTKTCRTLNQENDLEGYKLFRKVCKGCHSLTSADGKFLYSESKVGTAWNRVFAEKYPKCAKNGSWSKLSLDDQLKLNDYLFRAGADSFDPNDAKDCG